MLAYLIFLFIAVPLVDLILLLRIGEHLGFWATVALVVLTGIVGAVLARWQGVRTVGKIHTELAAGRLPAMELADGAMILFAAALFLTPGFLTDLVAVALLLPFVRRGFRALLIRFFRRQVHVTTAHVSTTFVNNGAQRSDGSIAFDHDAQSPRMKYVRNQATNGTPTADEQETDRAESESR